MADYVWDASVRRFRYADTQRFVARSTTLNISERSRANAQESLRQLGRQLAEGSVSAREFHQQASTLIRQIHVHSAALGAGGTDRVSPETWNRIGQNVRDQIGVTATRDGNTYGLIKVLNDWEAGDMSAAQLQSRLGMYGDSGKVSYFLAEMERQITLAKTHGYRQLGQAENCPDCVDLASLPPMPLNDLTMPTQGCRCRTNCKCSIVYLTLAEAVAMGAMS